MRKQKAVVISGGGAKGAYAAGCLYHLLHDLEINFDILCGVSVGSITAAFLAQFHEGEEKEAAQKLWDLWSTIENKDIYKKWFLLGKFYSLWKLAFYNSSPLHKLIEDNISLEKIRSTGKKVNVGLVNLNSGKYQNFDQTSDDFIDAVIASASFPVIFSPVKIGDAYYSDGGIKQISPITTAIDLGAKEIYALVTSPETRDKKFIKKLSIFDIMTRSFDLYSEKIMSNDIEKVLLHNKLAEKHIKGYEDIKLNLIRPKNNLIENFLNFDHVKIQEMMELGYKDAQLNPADYQNPSKHWWDFLRIWS
jgi:NTE family protein